MKYRENVILLPCHSLEDFPLHHKGDDAQSLLASWSALWHPTLIGCVEAIPTWSRVDEPPDNLADLLLVAPTVSSNELASGFAQRAKEEGAKFIRKKTDRQEIIELALESLDDGDVEVDQELVSDFLALGYAYLLQSLIRRMQYSNNLDEVHFNNQAVAAAKATIAGERDEAKERLTNCFDVLAEERDRFYPVDAFVIDLTLVAETTIGESLRQELRNETPVNLLMSASVLSALAEREPETLKLLQAALEKGTVGIIGGEVTERRLPLLSCESILGELRRGRSIYEKHLGQPPAAYGRRRFGLTPELPQILKKLGYEGALHATLDDGQFPEGSQIKTRWEGADGSSIDALARPPLDATKPETYLELAERVGESMHHDHVATVCLAHWPGKSSPWLDDLRRIANYSQALSRFVTINEYFRETDEPYHSDPFYADQYRSPYLKQAIIKKQADPISSSVNYWRRRAEAEAASSLNTLASLVTGDANQPLDDLLSEIDETSDSSGEPDLDAKIDDAVANAVKQFAECLPRESSDESAGYLVANPCNFVRRIGIEVPELDDLPAIERPIYSADNFNDTKQIVIDVPPMGFAWVAPTKKRASRRRRDHQNLAEDRTQDDGYCLLRNDFFEVLIDSTTGAIRSLYEYKSRGNRLSQQLAYRLPKKQTANPGDEWHDQSESAAYSVMAADKIEVTADSSTLGEVVVEGRLMDLDGTDLATYKQTFRLWRGSRILLLDIELDPKEEPRADAWNSYFAARFAWPDESAELWRTVNGHRQPVGHGRFESPQYVEIGSVDNKRRTTILTGGLPFHRKCGFRMLDSLLIVRGESARRFRMGIGIDLQHPMQAATSFFVPDMAVKQILPPPSPAESSWLFHIDAKNVIATYWAPLVEDGSISGFRVRLLESVGRPCRVTLSSFREVREAQQVDFEGKSLGSCTVEDGKTRVDLAAGEWSEVECRW